MLNQNEIAEHLDLSQQAASVFLNISGIDWKHSTLDVIRVTYIRRLREQAAGRATNGDLDLATERAGLAKAQRERIEMANAQTRRELAPMVTMSMALAKMSQQIIAVLDALPGMIKRQSQNLTSDDLEAIKQEVAKVRNIAAAVRIEPDELDRSFNDMDASVDA